MQETLINIINTWGYLGIIFLICIENVFPPIPSEVVLLFAGYLTTVTNMNPIFVVLSATIGALIGAIILYSLGYVLKKDKLKALFEGRFGKILHLRPEHIDMGYRWFIKYGNKAVLLCRCIPVARSLISIPAGISSMKFSLFLFLSTVGTLVWNIVLVTLGNILGETWEASLPYFKAYSEVALVGIVIIGVLFIYIKIKRRRAYLVNKNQEKT